MRYDPDLVFAKLGEGKTHQGRQVALLFEQPSTRTLMSFVLACHRIGATPTVMPAGATSMEKGESLTETVQNLGDMGYDAVVYRGFGVCGPTDIPVINAGNQGEHPTQALIDLYTAEWALRRQKSSDPEVKIKLVLDGDVTSRVAQSVAKMFRERGHTVHILYDESIVHVMDMDILMVFRWQDGRPCADPLMSIPPGVHLMAPGPVIDEIDHTLINHERSLIREQVRNSVWVRMGVLRHALS